METVMNRRVLRSLAVIVTTIAAMTVVGYATDGVIEINQARALAAESRPEIRRDSR